MQDVAPVARRRLASPRGTRRRRSILTLCLLAFFATGTLDVAWSAPPRKPPAKRAGPKKPPAKQQGKPAASKRKEKKPAPRSNATKSRRPTRSSRGTVSGVGGTARSGRPQQGHAIQHVKRIIRPEGRYLGVEVSAPRRVTFSGGRVSYLSIHEVRGGGRAAAAKVFTQLAAGRTPTRIPKGYRVDLAASVHVVYRPRSDSGPATVDVHVPGRYLKFKFLD